MRQKRRISRAEEEELVRAIKDDTIGNASAFAQEFAAEHGLNPTTVRSRISRLRRELGALTRGPSARLPRVDIALAAAVLVRYDEDEEFRRAVDRQRPEAEKLYRKLKELQGEHQDVMRLLSSPVAE